MIHFFVWDRLFFKLPWHKFILLIDFRLRNFKLKCLVCGKCCGKTRRHCPNPDIAKSWESILETMWSRPCGRSSEYQQEKFFAEWNTEINFTGLMGFGIMWPWITKLSFKDCRRTNERVIFNRIECFITSDMTHPSNVNLVKRNKIIKIYPATHPLSWTFYHQIALRYHI